MDSNPETGNNRPKKKIAVITYAVGGVGESAVAGILRAAGFSAGLCGDSCRRPEHERFLTRIFGGGVCGQAIAPSREMARTLALRQSRDYHAILRKEFGGEKPAVLLSPSHLLVPLVEDLTDFDVRIVSVERCGSELIDRVLERWRSSGDLVRGVATRGFVDRCVTEWERFGEDVQSMSTLPFYSVTSDDLHERPVESVRALFRFLEEPAPASDVVHEELNRSALEEIGFSWGAEESHRPGSANESTKEAGAAPADKLLFEAAQFIARIDLPPGAVRPEAEDLVAWLLRGVFPVSNRVGNAKDAARRASDLAARGDLEEAFDFIDRAYRDAPNQPELISTRANLAFLRGDVDEARSEFERCIEIAPHYLSAYHDLSGLLIALDAPEEARGITERALEQSPRDRVALEQYATLCAGLGDFSTAADTYDALLAGRPELETALALGLCAFRAGEGERARAAYQVALTIDPANEIAQENLEVVEETIGRAR